ncbi:MAG: FeoB-associated Cys-rich membrane protein [Candidatus Falkowbacteria bacterium]|nr:FeoB-associated Cys-rich membrane protein [Candidatus Falkowbacteria bacterium]
MKYIFSTIFLSFALLLAVLPAQAAKLILKTDLETIQKNGGGKIEILLDSPDEKVNALGGELFVSSGQATLSDINDGQSIISAWLDQPVISNNGSLVFSGIIPGGFSGLYAANTPSVLPGLVLSFNIKSQAKGNVTLSFKNVQAYANQGESVKIITEPETLAINFDHLAENVNYQADDKVAPTDIDFSIIKMPDTKLGWVAIFSAQDSGSGIDHYEIQESLLSKPENDDWRKATSPVALQDQSRNKYVFIKAVDRSGNQKIVSLPPEPNTLNNLYYLAAGLIIILVTAAFVIYRFIKNKK